jgi:5-methyltetrahydropteroyltriglutamate--homocysteine methyltransferase
MLTTVVGSYPSHPQEPSSFSSKLSSLLGNYDPYQAAVESAVKDQVKSGVNLVSTGQVRGDMVEIFACEITGMAWEEETSKIKGKILPLNYSIGANDIKIALKTASHISEDFEKAKKVLINVNLTKLHGVKGIITGPTTMVLSSRMEGFYTVEKRDKAILDMPMPLTGSKILGRGRCRINTI